MITINLNKAKMIVIDNIRKNRIPILEKLDIEYFKALEQNNTDLMKIISDKKQALRDAPNSNLILNAQNIEELLSIDLMSL
jgi:hypothetical protein